MLFRECFCEFVQKQYCGFPVFEYIKKAQVQCERDILGTHRNLCLCELLSPGWHLALWRLGLTRGDRRVPGCAASLGVAAHRSVGAAALEGGGPWGSSDASCAGANLGCPPSREPHAAALESPPFSQKDFFHLQEEINNPPLLPIK